MDFKAVLKLTGGLILILGMWMMIPALYGALNDDVGTMPLVKSALGALAVGIFCYWSQRKYRAELNHRTGIAVVGLTWVIAALVGALPFYVGGVVPTYIDGVFESASGFTGTGASVILDVEAVSPAILLWRSITQWIAGVGIIVFFIAVLPIMGMGGMQLFRAETTGPSKDKITPRVRETARVLWGLYLGLTGTLVLVLYLLGMSLFDAVNHSMTTMATGGFSTKASGIAAYNNPFIEYAIILFMFIGAINFSLHFKLFIHRDIKALWSTELKWFVGIIALTTIACTAALAKSNLYEAGQFEELFRDSLFTVVCTVSTTGFTGPDFIHWPVAAQFVLVLLMIMGGMSGSTAGGLKCIRLATAVKQLSNEIKRVVHPHGLFSIKINKHSVSPEVINAIWGFIFLYFFVLVGITGVLTAQGIDLVSATTGTISALSNVGPGLGTLGPYANYAALPDLSKIALVCGMLLGRLEFYTLIALFSFEYWRK